MYIYIYIYYLFHTPFSYASSHTPLSIRLFRKIFFIHLFHTPFSHSFFIRPLCIHKRSLVLQNVYEKGV